MSRKLKIIFEICDLHYICCHTRSHASKNHHNEVIFGLRGRLKAKMQLQKPKHYICD